MGKIIYHFIHLWNAMKKLRLFATSKFIHRAKTLGIKLTLAFHFHQEEFLFLVGSIHQLRFNKELILSPLSEDRLMSITLTVTYTGLMKMAFRLFRKMRFKSVEDFMLQFPFLKMILLVNKQDLKMAEYAC